jgi:surface polysaccharide O-acyltransferase-like enzyme
MGQDKTTFRQFDLDLLRVIGAFAVIWLHVSGDVLVDTSRGFDFTWWFGNFANAISRWGVPVFVMVSGALFLSKPIDGFPLSFYKQKFIRLGIPIVIWTSFYTLLAWRSLMKYGGVFDSKEFAISIIRGMPMSGFHLWYLYMGVGLYALAPIVHFVLSGMTQKWKVSIIVTTFVIACFNSTISLSGIGTGTASTFLGLCIPYLPYFAMGHLLRERAKISKRHLAFLIMAAIVCAALIAVLTAILFPFVGKRSWMMLNGYLSPFVIVMSLCVYRAVIAIEWSRLSYKYIRVLVRHIAPVTLGVYVIHPFCLMVLTRYGLNAQFINPVIGIPLTTITAFIMAIVMSRIIAMVPYMHKSVE